MKNVFDGPRLSTPQAEAKEKMKFINKSSVNQRSTLKLEMQNFERETDPQKKVQVMQGLLSSLDLECDT